MGGGLMMDTAWCVGEEVGVEAGECGDFWGWGDGGG